MPFLERSNNFVYSPETIDEELGSDAPNDDELSKLACTATGGGSTDSDEDDALSYFQKLVKSDERS